MLSLRDLDKSIWFLVSVTWIAGMASYIVRCLKIDGLHDLYFDIETMLSGEGLASILQTLLLVAANNDCK